MTKKFTHPQGSILIWTVLLGVSLATVFLYFSERLNSNATLQRRSIQYHQSSQFIESYADYLESLSVEELKAFPDGQLALGEITGSVTRLKSQILGSLDAGDVVQYEVASGRAKVEWGLCAKNEAERVLEITPNEGVNIGNCSLSGFDYDDWAETTGPLFTLKAVGAPISYKITPIEESILYDRAWTIKLEIQSTSRQAISLQREFIPHL